MLGLGQHDYRPSTCNGGLSQKDMSSERCFKNQRCPTDRDGTANLGRGANRLQLEGGLGHEAPWSVEEGPPLPRQHKGRITIVTVSHGHNELVFSGGPKARCVGMRFLN